MIDRLRGIHVPRPLLASGAILLLVMPVAAYSIAVRGALTSDVADRSAHDRVDSARLASRLIAHDLEEAGQALTYLARSPEVQTAFRADDRATLATALARFSAAWPAYLSELALDTAGLETVIANSGTPARAIARGNDRSDRDYFTGAIASRGPFVSEAYRSGAPGNPVLVAVSVAVRDGDGRVLGVLVATIRPSDLIGSLKAADDTAGRDLVIVDKRSHVVASTDSARELLSDAGLPAVADGLAGRSGTTVQRIDGGDHVVTYAPISGAAWVLYVVDEPGVVLAVERGLQRSVGIAGGLATLVAALFAAAVVFLFAVLSRRSDELARSRAALVTSNADLALANRHKSEFLSGVSHELRTPMNAILGFTDLLDEQLREAITERQRRYFRNIREAGEHLLGLIDDVLDLSRIESGRIDLHPEVVTLEHLVEPVAANARRAAAEHGLRCEAEVAQASVGLDVGRIRQVLFNLASNAVKFTPEGGAIRCRAWTEGDTLAVDVSDTGIGIPVDRAARVFGMFERVNEDRSSAKGTGLGLALSKRIVETHGGTITFESAENAGATFHVRLPGVVVRTADAAEVAHALVGR